MVLMKYKGIVKAQAGNGDEDYELKQVKDMAAAKKRWEALVGIFFFFIFKLRVRLSVLAYFPT